MSSKGKSRNRFEPITVVYTWRVNEGQDKAFKTWLHGIAGDAMKFPGHLGVTTLRQPGSTNIYQSVLRFDNQKHLDAWLNSKERAAWIKRLSGIATEQKNKLTGLENWFEIPGTTPPPRWKIVIATFIAVYPVSLLLNELVSPHVAHLNIFIRALLFPVVLPILLTYFLMPLVTQKLLKHWLYK